MFEVLNWAKLFCFYSMLGSALCAAWRKKKKKSPACKPHSFSRAKSPDFKKSSHEARVALELTLCNQDGLVSMQRDTQKGEVSVPLK